MVTFTRACGERLFPSSIGVMSDLSAEPDMLTRISARYGQYGLDGDGVYVPDPTLFARPCYNAHAPLFALHMGPYASGEEEVRVAVVEDLCEVRNCGTATTAKLLGAWADLGWQVVGQGEDVDRFAINKAVDEAGQREYFLPCAGMFFRQGATRTEQWWKPSDADLGRRLVGLYHWVEHSVVRIRRDPVSGCIVSRFRDKAFKIGGRLTVRQLAEACQSVTLPNNVYQRKLRQGRKISLADETRPGLDKRVRGDASDDDDDGEEEAAAEEMSS